MCQTSYVDSLITCKKSLTSSVIYFGRSGQQNHLVDQVCFPLDVLSLMLVHTRMQCLVVLTQAQPDTRADRTWLAFEGGGLSLSRHVFARPAYHS